MGKVSIIGLGHIGMNILQTFAQAGIDALGVEQDQSSIARGLERSKGNLETLIKKGKISPERRDEILSKMKVIKFKKLAVSDSRPVTALLPLLPPNKSFPFVEDRWGHSAHD